MNPDRTNAEADRWAAIVARDATQDEHFWYSVTTTGIYCRPSCPARRPRRENVAFHDSRLAAEAAGFRPCRRCRPDLPPLAERQAQAVATACREIEAAEAEPDLARLAAGAGLSRWYFLRIFKAITGITPKAYATAIRRDRVRDRLAGGGTATAAILDAGFGSPTRFYAEAAAALGMTPRQFRARGHGVALRVAVVDCWLGQALVAASDRGVCAILLGDDAGTLRQDLRRRFPAAELSEGGPEFVAITQQVLALVEAPAGAHALPLDIRGTAFQYRVWQALRAIPAGTTSSYAELARGLGAPGAARAVAAACAANPLAVAVPCHRVVRGDGDLAGYRWGLDRKRSLLEREQATVTAASPENPAGNGLRPPDPGA